MLARSTADSIERTIISADTVYLRSDIKYVSDEDFEGWEYYEEQVSKDDFITRIQYQNDILRVEQTQTSTTLLELMEVVLLGGS